MKIRVSKAERDLLQLAADKCGLQLSTFCREALEIEMEEMKRINMTSVL